MSKFYLSIVCLFSAALIVSNFITPKLILLFGVALPAGLITYPITFFISDFVTEIYGKEKARFMIYLGFAMTLLACLMVSLALSLPAYDAQFDLSFQSVFSKSPIIIFASLAAYATSQLLDIKLYSLIHKWTGPSHLWLRSNASTLIAQLFDTLIATTITFGLDLELEALIFMIAASYTYKALFSLLSTPFYYLAVNTAKKASCA